jgi:catechol 2,3-dioxygenase-like lactoylglutathione lyase family enzyme
VKVTRVQHVSVNTNDVPLADMVAFYRDVLGLDDAARPEVPGVPGHWHRAGGTEVHLVDAAPRGTRIDPRGNHYCLTVEDLDGAIDELDARGVDYVKAVQGADTVQIWIVDPAGNTIELQQEPGTA